MPPWIGQTLQELTQRCNNAQQENDILRSQLNTQALDIADMRKQIGDMWKQIKDLQNWNWAHMQAETAGVRSSGSDSGNTWGRKGSNSGWSESTWWDVGDCKENHGK